MVKQTRIVFEVKDFIAFRVVCEKCGGEVVHSFEDSFPDAPGQCPWCHHFREVGQVNRLIGTIRTMLHNHGLTGLRLELDGETVAQPDTRRV